ncbi:MAG: DUF4091 domain-containing protein [Thermoguttaceae bacterium]|nr:DUF4091 domain-containing protein [Thermoguttaceae bacterium]
MAFWPFFIIAIFVNAFLSGGEPNNRADSRLDFATPNAWRLDSGEGTILPSADGVTGAVLQVKGNGQGGNRWIHSGYAFNEVRNASPQGLCMFRFKARMTQKEGGSCMAGSLFSFGSVPISDSWQSRRLIFPVSSRVNKDVLRLILYSGHSTFQFAEAEIKPIIASFGPLGMAAEETYWPEKGIWSHHSRFGDEGGSWTPALRDFSATFNSNRWSLGSGSYLTYCFTAPGQELFYGGTINVNLANYTGGELFVELSTNGKEWKKIGGVSQLTSPIVSLPSMKMSEVWLRFRGGEKSAMQLGGFQFDANLRPDSDRKNGETSQDTLTEGVPQMNGLVRGSTIFWEVVEGDTQVPAESLSDLRLPRNNVGQQEYEKKVQWQDANHRQCAATLRTSYYVSNYESEDYGHRLNRPYAGSIAFWWSDATHKIFPGRKLPPVAGNEEARAVSLSAASNDCESAQLVLYPEKNATVGPVRVSSFVSKNGKTIAADRVEVRRPYYHDIKLPSDKISPTGLVPDALPPMEKEVKIAAKTNFPIWLTVNVPPRTAPGDYEATASVTVRIGEKVNTYSVPIKLHVWNFELPVENTVETAFGFDNHLCYKYHHVTTREDQKRLTDQYFRMLGRYRINVYNPIPFASIKRKSVVDKEHPEKSYVTLDFTEFDKAFEHARSEYHFNRARLSLPGMGGGTFEKRIEPHLDGYQCGTPEYEALFASYVRQVEQHLLQKGWIDLFYLYWFDEPDTKDYEFVRQGMNRVKKYAPRLRTMLTEEPQPGFAGKSTLGKVDVWAMIIDRYNAKAAEECWANNEVLWTYMTNVPTPYPAQFMEHAACDLRVWLWHSWKYRCPGVLIWTTNYWTSSTAYPDPNLPQNPYTDPGVYQSGYGLAKGIKHLWGNGDARQVYPPLSCATPAKEPNFDLPVPSIRLEMLREGIEDYEMLVLLKNELAQATAITPQRRAEMQELLTVPADIAVSWTQFTTDPGPIYRHREKVARAIEELIKAKTQK